VEPNFKKLGYIFSLKSKGKPGVQLHLAPSAQESLPPPGSTLLVSGSYASAGRDLSISPSHTEKALPSPTSELGGCTFEHHHARSCRHV
jgi:hypothetical protein